MKKSPNYQRIYTDIIQQKFPHKLNECRTLLEKQRLYAIDVIQLNKIIFNTKERDVEEFDQKHRSYDKESIIKILDFQFKNKLNNNQIANLYKLSRNTVAKWKKLYDVQKN
ncbi:helix-turn-helix domain-containing protein [Chryseobacterium sp. Mn2064]|uniref:helix-turn-helix domain-containing protein n=1 Tax=Chryseobacterium sp. Mn2064 TaxID=3395263 RepID=UPI003BBEC1BB